MERKIIENWIHELVSENAEMRSIARDKIKEIGVETLPCLLEAMFDKDWQLRFYIAKISDAINYWSLDVINIYQQALRQEKNIDVAKKLYELFERIELDYEESYAFENQQKFTIDQYINEERIIIPAFEYEEMADITPCLLENGIAFQIHNNVLFDKDIPVADFYIFEVSNAQFKDAVVIIKAYLEEQEDQEDQGDEDMAALCPACQAEIEENDLRCPDCDLNLAAPSHFSHPFFAFLETVKENI